MPANPTHPAQTDEARESWSEYAKAARELATGSSLYSASIPACRKQFGGFMRVAAFLAEHRVHCETLLHPPAYTAQKRARFLHVPGRHVAKCVLLRCGAGWAAAVLPATHRVDTTVLAIALEAPVRLAKRDEIADIFRDCEWGVIPPFASLYGLPTLLDDSIDPDRVLVFEGYTHGVAFRIRCRDFEDYEKPRRLRFAQPRNLSLSSQAV